MTEVQIKRTDELTPEALVAIMQARCAVFVVEQHCPYQEVDAKDFEAEHVQLLQDGQLAAYARIVPHDDGQAISFGRVLVVKDKRHEGLGRQVVAQALKEIAARYPKRQVKIQAQAYLQAFYAGFGFQAVSDVYLEDGIPHLDMVLKGSGERNE